MKKVTIVFNFLLFLAVLQSKSQQLVEYRGSLVSFSGQLYPMSLSFSIQGETIKGYTETYGEQDFYSRSKVVGRLGKEEADWYFSETEIELITDSSLLPYMCLLEYRITDKKDVSGKSIIQGTYRGHFQNGIACDSGRFVFTDARVPKIAMKKAVSLTASFNESPLAKLKPDNDKILERSEVYLAVTEEADNYLAFYDGGILDKDRLRFVELDTGVDTEVNLLSEAVSYSVSLKRGQQKSIAVIAENEGNTPPNTAKIVLGNSSGVIDTIVTRLQKQDTTYIFLLRK